MTPNLDNRIQLGFIQEASASLQFLLQDFGYTILYKSNYLVRLGKNNEYVEIYHERISYEIYVLIRLEDTIEGSYEANLADILEWKGKTTQRGVYQASTQKAVLYVMQIMADNLKQFALDFINGDIESFKKLTTFVEDNLKLMKRDM